MTAATVQHTTVEEWYNEVVQELSAPRTISHDEDAHTLAPQ